ncbi:hypothetical protein DPMN_071579 [Dreissena polymorpha]|uniref:Uncharacterized protein n=1 Tax=Dreissena polymorpha TaxID=45954 RepID=A0A9D4BXD6_DREPO|nr:hypothetical protein DPMN_071579 [Dreissena polymorpha]
MIQELISTVSGTHASLFTEHRPSPVDRRFKQNTGFGGYHKHRWYTNIAPCSLLLSVHLPMVDRHRCSSN